MKQILNPPFYRISIFNNSSWGGWVTVKECKTKQRALEHVRLWKGKGYETTIEGITQ